MNRILWNSGENDIDEVVFENVDVHIEQMTPRMWWIGIYIDGVETYWSGNFVCDSRGRMSFMEQERAGFDWDEEASHA